MPAGFIAETDATGRVLWVWRQGADDRVARPVVDAVSCVRELETARFFGADAGAIWDWISEHANTSQQGV